MRNLISKKQLWLIIGAVLLAAVLPLFLFPGDFPTDVFTVGGRNYVNSWSEAAMRTAYFMFFIAHAFVVYAGFKCRLLWGLISLLVPFGSIVFLILFWQTCRDAFPFLAAGFIFLLLSWLLPN